LSASIDGLSSERMPNPMKSSRAVHHLEDLANACSAMAGRPATIFPLRVTELWTYGDILSSQDDIDAVQVALVVDLPVDDVAWLCHPAGAEHWSKATRLSRNPILAVWRSQRAPVWNHRVERPLLIWDEPAGVGSDALAALREGTADGLRLTAPSAEERRSRLEAELATSHRALGSAAADYERRRFSPGKVEPVADALWRATAGYLDVQSDGYLDGLRG